MERAEGMSDPYLIEGPAAISFSGGRTSGYMLKHVLDAHGGSLPSDVVPIFANTGKERLETLDFVQACETHWNVRVHWVEWRPGKLGFIEVDYSTASRSGEPFSQLIAKKKMPPNWQMRYCTQYLKVHAMTKFMKTIVPAPKPYKEVIGLRYDEGHRIFKMLARNETDGRLCIAPMSKAKVTLRDVRAWWNAKPFDLQLEPGEGNCDLCFLKGRGLRKELIRRNPASVDWWDEQERLTQGFFDRRDRYSELREEVRRSPDMFDMSVEHDVECGLLCAST
jgi:3'-phosphoadenosine 5'-phosphosulfate sulfotransferase (PAPS reductase)/FAD synthetase